MDNSSSYTQLIGTDRPGVEVTAITDVKLDSPQLTFIPAPPDQIRFSTLSRNSKGIIDEINSAGCKLNFLLSDPFSTEEKRAIFWIKRRDFDRFFKR